MPTQALLTEAFKIQQPKLITLLEIFITDAIILRYAGHESNIAWFTYSSNAWQAATYTAFPIQLDAIGQQNTEGRFESQTIRITNIDKGIGDYIRQNDVRGNKVFITGVLENLIADAADRVFRWKYRIANASAPKSEAQFQIQSYFAETMSEVPLQIRGKNECGWDFDKDGTDPVAAQTCGWYSKYAHVYYSGSEASALDSTNYTNASITKCDKGIDTANGCKAHFNQNDTNKPNLRAQAYQGIPAKPIQRITI